MANAGGLLCDPSRAEGAVRSGLDRPIRKRPLVQLLSCVMAARSVMRTPNPNRVVFAGYVDLRNTRRDIARRPFPRLATELERNFRLRQFGSPPWRSKSNQESQS